MPDADAARPGALGLRALVVLLLALAPHYLMTLPAPGGQVMAATSALSALAVLAVILRRTRQGQLVGVGRRENEVLAAVAIGNGLGLIAWSGRADQSIMLMVAIVAVGAMITRTSVVVRWQLIGLGGGVGLSLWRVGAESSVHVGLGLLTATALGGVLHGTRTVAESRLHSQLDALAQSRSALEESGRQYRDLFDASPIGIGVVDHLGVFTEVNPAMCRIVGRERDELVGRTSAVYTHPDDVELTARVPLAGDGPVRHSLRKRVVRPDGQLCWIDLSATTSAGPDGLSWTVGYMHDVSEKVLGAAALARSQDNLAAIAAVVRGIHSGHDVRSAIVAAACTIAGANTAVLFEADGADHLAVTAEAGIDLLGLRIALTDRSGTAHVWRTGEPLFVADPTDHPLVSPALIELTSARSVLYQPIALHGAVAAVLTATWGRRVGALDDDAARAVQLLAAEATIALERESLILSLEVMAATDPLTGLANRRSWDEGLAAAMARARRSGSALTVALLDFDYFKAYNDEHGHGAGDALLRQFATAAGAVVRDVDLLARWGGEEFALMLTDLAQGAGAELAIDRVRGCMPAPTTCSAGFATWDGDENAQQLMRRADAGLYEAKRAGRDRTCGVQAPMGLRDRRR